MLQLKKSAALRLIVLSACLLISQVATAQNQSGTSARVPPLLANGLNCDEQRFGLCLDRADRTSYEGKYLGHDEPALLFYSNEPGSGNNSTYRLILPKDPPTPPRQDGTGGTFNFQLQATFWFGMALCDTESFPEFTRTCVPDSDSNIFDNIDPNAPDFIGRHPGTAILEVQFFPPGFFFSCVPTQWCVALTIDSFSRSGATGQLNNSDCLEKVGVEPVNFAYITTDGIPAAFPPNPLRAPFGQMDPDFSNALLMDPGDTIVLSIRDTPQGLRVVVRDLTSGQTGQMTAGDRNGFGQVVFDPDGKHCRVRPYSFHPMYSTSSEHTRVPWTVHSFNVSASDEIGHFEFCDSSDPATLRCTLPGVDERAGLDSDDAFCITPPSPLNPPPFVQLGGCLASDSDFDGASYHQNWAGTNTVTDALLHPEPMRFTSPTFLGRNGARNYSRIAFESDTGAIESQCDVFTGENCVNPPPGAEFYPTYSTTSVKGRCMWQFGGPNIPGTTNNFGGDAASEFGPMYAIPFQFVPFANHQLLFELFHRTMDNPCPSALEEDDAETINAGRSP